MRALFPRAAAAAGVALLTGAAQAATIDLTGIGFVQYGDGQSYSLPVANYQYGFPLNTGPFAIDSTPGAIKDLVVVATGTSGTPVTENFAGMDNAYATPSGVSGDTFFYANPVTNQGSLGTIAHNGDSTWDASLASLMTFLRGEQMVVFFNNNQVNSGGTADQSLAAWSRIWITDTGGGVVANSTFEFTNNDGAYDLVSMGGGGQFLGDVTTYTAAGSGAGNPSSSTGPSPTDYVLSGGQLCVATGGAYLVPTPVPCSTVPGPGVTISPAINHNLGADHAAYAIIFPELNALLDTLFADASLDLSQYTLHADVRLGCGALNVATDRHGDPIYGTTGLANWMACDTYNGWGTALNNGYEQIFIGTAIVGQCPPTDPQCNPTVPEPGSLALLGVALAALGLSLPACRRAVSSRVRLGRRVPGRGSRSPGRCRRHH